MVFTTSFLCIFDHFVDLSREDRWKRRNNKKEEGRTRMCQRHGRHVVKSTEGNRERERTREGKGERERKENVCVHGRSVYYTKKKDLE